MKVSRREFCSTTLMSLAALATGSNISSLFAEDIQKKNVRIGFIGVGDRGYYLLKVILDKPFVQIAAICDIDKEKVSKAVELVQQIGGYVPAKYSNGPYDYKNMLKRDDVDAVLIATPGSLHVEMSVDAMLAGKHVGSEVPGAITVHECWKLIKTKEETNKRYMLLENYNYMQQNMMVYNMTHAGVFGKTYYAECSYIHDCRFLRFNPDGTLTWRGEWKRDRFGNLYPTHSLGPVSKWLDINRGDRIVSVTSQMSQPAVLHEYAVEHFGADSEAAKTEFKAGDMCHTLLKTESGRLIDIQYDSDSPRPRSNFYLLQGTKGVYDSRKGVYIEGRSSSEQWEPFENYLKKYEDKAWKEHSAKAKNTGHGGSDYFVLNEFVEMARNDSEPFIDVYDSAVWSAVAELSAESIKNGGAPVEMPDFTNGRWKNRK